MKTIVLTILTFYFLKPALAAPKGRRDVMAFREQNRFRSCCFVDIFCFTVCFHSGERRNTFAAGESMDNIRHFTHKRQKVLSRQRTNSNLDNNDRGPFHLLNEPRESSINGPHRHRHRHGERIRAKRSTSLLWNKLRLVQNNCKYFCFVIKHTTSALQYMHAKSIDLFHYEIQPWFFIMSYI